MDLDYYQTLGVSPEADLATIKRAYWNKCLVCHPDRGGSHAEMLLINEAWEILADSAKRAAYDEARLAFASASIKQSAAHDREKARERAQQYPRNWSDFETWLHSVRADVQAAHYSSRPIEGPMGLGMYFPTAGNSITGWLCILLGASITGYFLTPLVLSLAKEFGFKLAPPQGFIIGGIAIAPIVGGAWIGAVVHAVVKAGILEIESRSGEGNPDSAPGYCSAEHRIVICAACGQKLRVPDLQETLKVTCGKCGKSFESTSGKC